MLQRLTPIHHQPHRQRGFTLVELGIALSLVAALLIGAFYIVRSIRADTVRMAFGTSAARVVNTANKFMANNMAVTGADTTSLYYLGAWDKDMVLTSNAASGILKIKSTIPGAWEHAWNNGGAFIQYRIANVPKEHCLNVLTELAKLPTITRVVVNTYVDETGDMPTQPSESGTVTVINNETTSTNKSLKTAALTNLSVCERERTWMMVMLSRVAF